MPLKFILFIAIFLFPQLALSQIYKCKNTKGKIIYSEATCPSGTKGAELYLEPNIIDNSALRRQIATQKMYREPTSQAGTMNNSDSSDGLMSEYEKQIRLRELQIDMKNDQASSERKADARNEHSYLLRGQIKNLSYDNELKRRNLKVDLESYDKLKRMNALSLLASIYIAYQ